MSLIVKDSGGGIDPISAGVHVAVCTGLVDLGIHESEKFKKTMDKMLIMWSITDEVYTDMDGVEHPRAICKEYTKSLNQKSNLAKDLNAWRGVKFTPEELAGFDTKKVLGVPCQLTIEHNTTEKGTYADIGGIIGVPKGMKVDAAQYETIIFDLDDPDTFIVFRKLPEWIQNKVLDAKNLEETGFDQWYEQNKDIEPVDDDELPF